MAVFIVLGYQSTAVVPRGPSRVNEMLVILEGWVGVVDDAEEAIRGQLIALEALSLSDSAGSEANWGRPRRCVHGGGRRTHFD